MFCPNCGNNCGDAKFCTACGTQVQKVEVQKQQENSWPVGKPCPYCGGTEVKNGLCAFCGVQLVNDIDQQPDAEERFEIPVGRYSSKLDAVELHNKALSLQNAIFFKIQETIVPYDQLCTITFVRPIEIFNGSGSLLFQWREREATKIKEGAIAFNSERELLFYHVFCVLRAAIPDAVCTIRSSAIYSQQQVLLEAELNTDAWYREFGADRSKAIKYVEDATGASFQIAKALVDCVLDVQQKAQYEKNPCSAVRDLRWVKGKIEQERERRRQEREINRYSRR